MSHPHPTGLDHDIQQANKYKGANVIVILTFAAIGLGLWHLHPAARYALLVITGVGLTWRIVGLLAWLELPKLKEEKDLTSRGADQFESPSHYRCIHPLCSGGAGEDVFLTGNLHVLLRFTMDQAGGIHVASHFQPQGISGTGQTSGDKYQATGVTQDEFNAKLGVEETFVNNFRIIGERSGNNFLIHETFHITFNAHGVPTASVDNFSVDCR